MKKYGNVWSENRKSIFWVVREIESRTNGRKNEEMYGQRNRKSEKWEVGQTLSTALSEMKTAM